MIAEDVRGGELCPTVDGRRTSRTPKASRGILAITVPGLVADGTSREILLTDLLTAFRQQTGGSGHRAGTARARPGRSGRSAARRSPLIRRSSRAASTGWRTPQAQGCTIADATPANHPVPTTSCGCPRRLTAEDADEVDRARRMFQFTIDEMLLAALAQDARAPRSATALSPSTLPGTAGRFSSRMSTRAEPSVASPRSTRCGSTASAASTPTRSRCWTTCTRSLTAVPHHGIGYGLLRYLHAPTARLLGRNRLPPDIFFSNVGMIPDLPSTGGPVEFDVDTAMPVRDKAARPWAIRSRCGCIARRVACTWTGGTTRVGFSGQRWRRSRSSSQWRSWKSVREAMVTGRADDESSSASAELGLVDLSAE